MKATSILFSISFIISSCSSSKALSDSEIIRNLFESYKSSTLKEDYNTAFDLIYPEVFSGSSKKEKVDNIKEAVHNSDYDIIFNEIDSDTLYQVEKYGSNKYSLMKISSKVSFHLKKYLSDSLQYSKYFNYVCKGLKNQLGDQNVTCNLKNKSIDAIQRSNAYFIFDYKYKKWFILSDDVPENVEKFIPFEIRQKFGIEIK